MLGVVKLHDYGFEFRKSCRENQMEKWVSSVSRFMAVNLGIDNSGREQGVNVRIFSKYV